MTQTTARPATDKQVAFAEKLIDERVTDPAEAAQYRAALANLTTKSISELIDHLLALPAPAPLAYQGPEADHVMVSKRHAKCALCDRPTFAGQAHASVVAKVWSSYHFAGECPEGEVQPSGIDFRASLEKYGKQYKAGDQSYISLHLADPAHADTQQADETRLKVRVRLTVGSDWVNVTDDAEYGRGKQYGSQRPGAEYVGDASDTLARMLADVPRSIAAYGEITSHCGCCSLKLEAGISVARQIGPDCWTKHYEDFSEEFIAEAEARVEAFLATAKDTDADVTA
jgi:hypothetical protein